jgi:hypothetical protein
MQLGRRRRYCVEASSSDVEADVLHTEKGVVGGGSGVFAWTKEEEKRDRYHVADGLFVIFAAGSMGKVQDVNYDEDGNRLDTGRGESSFL